MNTTARNAARERLLDAALLEVLTGSAATAMPAAALLPRRPRQAAFAAAMVLLGIGVAATVWVSSTLSAIPVRQAAEPLPPAVKVEGEAVTGLDTACANLNWEGVQPAHLPLLRRFPNLRRLRINPDTAPGKTEAWQAATAAELLPICALEQLEELHLPFCWKLSSAHLQRLGTCKRLRALSLVNQSVVLDEAVVAELAKWPALRELHLLVIALTSKGMAALAQLPLQHLELWRCRGLDAEGAAAITKSAALQHLALTGLGQPDPSGWPDRQQVLPTSALTPAVMSAIARMPALRELSLRACLLNDEVIAALPDGLRSLDLAQAEGVSVAALRRLRRLGNLRSLTIGGDAGADGQEGMDAEVAHLLGTLRLEKLGWQRTLTPAIVAAVIAQPDLRELGLSWHEGTELAFAARMPRLEVLGLTPTSVPVADARDPLGPGHSKVFQPGGKDLEPLRQCRSLQRVELHAAAATTAVGELREGLGPRITLVFVE